MEDALLNAFNSGNITSILCATIVYVIIYLQRKQTANQRDIDKELMKKDIDNLKQRADSTDTHFTNMEKQLVEINKTLVELCTLMKVQQRTIEKFEDESKKDN